MFVDISLDTNYIRFLFFIKSFSCTILKSLKMQEIELQLQEYLNIVKTILLPSLS